MLQRIHRSLLAIMMLALPGIAQSDGRPLDAMQALAGTVHYELQAEQIERPFHVLVLEPATATAESYPAVYLLDGGVTFPMLAAYSRYLKHQGTIPELVIVGISYGADSFEDGNFRSNDYTAPSDERDYWGGAEMFQAFLADELIPMIEENHPADPSRRILFGQSIGGQFVLFSAFTSPDLFHGRIASNPALHRNLDWFLREPEAGSGNGRLFVSSAGNDEPVYREPAMAWIEAFAGSSGLPWALQTESISGHGHFSVITEAYRQGLKWILTPDLD